MMGNIKQMPLQLNSSAKWLPMEVTLTSVPHFKVLLPLQQPVPRQETAQNINHSQGVSHSHAVDRTKLQQPFKETVTLCQTCCLSNLYELKLPEPELFFLGAFLCCAMFLGAFWLNEVP